jgi:hypothetical protein
MKWAEPAQHLVARAHRYVKPFMQRPTKQPWFAPSTGTLRPNLTFATGRAALLEVWIAHFDSPNVYGVCYSASPADRRVRAGVADYNCPCHTCLPYPTS